MTFFYIQAYEMTRGTPASLVKEQFIDRGNKNTSFFSCFRLPGNERRYIDKSIPSGGAFSQSVFPVSLPLTESGAFDRNALAIPFLGASMMLLLTLLLHTFKV